MYYSKKSRIEALKYGIKSKCEPKEVQHNMSNSFQFTPEVMRTRTTEYCIYCGSELANIFSISDQAFWDTYSWRLDICPSCLWWRSVEFPEHYFHGNVHVGILRDFNYTKIEPELQTVIEEIKSNKEKIYSLDPTKFEKFIGKIISNILYTDVLHVGKSHDGGIDLIIIDAEIGHIPIQVKRRSKKGKIESVALIREFRGAMLLKGYSEGMIFTTADDFSVEAKKISVPSPQHLVPQTIHLFNCREILNLINVLGNDFLDVNFFKKGFRINPPEDIWIDVEKWLLNIQTSETTNM